MRFRLIFLALGLASAAYPQSQVSGALAGIVFEDANGNGERDPAEPGIPGVSVCTRSDCGVTDEEGLYEVAVEPGYGVAWVSQPMGYRPTRGFYRRIPEDPFEWLSNFGLERVEPVSEFRFLHASDTHLDAESLPRIRRLREIAAEQKVDFVIVTGDLIRDALRVPEKTARERFEMFRKEKEEFPVPVWVVPGNHEIFGIERHLSGVPADHPLYGKAMFERYLGPTYYSFNYGGIHFVGLDTADIADQWYYGHVDETQLRWLEKDLSYVSAETPIVTFNHIPLFSAVILAGGYEPDSDSPGSVIEVDGKKQFRHVVSNFAEVLGKLEGRNYPLALGGHVHAREEIVLGDARFPTRFNQSAAVVGPAGQGYEMKMISGVKIYRVRDGVIDSGEFIALDADDVDKAN
ncbi:MAG: metallophosphoesterase [Vicinamibacteria bacterium]